MTQQCYPANSFVEAVATCLYPKYCIEFIACQKLTSTVSQRIGRADVSEICLQKHTNKSVSCAENYCIFNYNTTDANCVALSDSTPGKIAKENQTEKCLPSA